jgi:hypothetical protein
MRNSRELRSHQLHREATTTRFAQELRARTLNFLGMSPLSLIGSVLVQARVNERGSVASAASRNLPQRVKGGIVSAFSQKTA